MGVVELMLAGLVAGTLGALLGIGGGVLLVPALVFLMNVPLQSAVPASLLCVVAGSCSAASRYLLGQNGDVRLALPLELATVSGAIAGGFMGALVPPKAVAFIFGLFCLYIAVQFGFLRAPREMASAPVEPFPVRYPLGIGGSFVAGSLSSLLGVGGGPFKVPLMAYGMRVPFKVATATSNFMVGITGAASLLTYAWRGQLPLALSSPLVVGVLAGSALGTRFMPLVPTHMLKRIFSGVMLLVGLEMLWRGGGVSR